MSDNILNADLFVGSLLFYENQLSTLLNCCVDIYNDILSNDNHVKNRENSIRDCFFNYLNNDSYRNNIKFLQNFHFEKESQENTGYLDIKVKTLNPYGSTKAYYIIECKRLNAENLKGATGLNAEYVKNGICRFITGYYSYYFGCNAMFGFVVETVDVQKDIVNNVNSMLNTDYINAQGEKVNANAIQPMHYENFANSYPYSYVSTHTCKSGKELTLYHLMFDFSQNIE